MNKKNKALAKLFLKKIIILLALAQMLLSINPQGRLIVFLHSAQAATLLTLAPLMKSLKPAAIYEVEDKYLISLINVSFLSNNQALLPVR